MIKLTSDKLKVWKNKKEDGTYNFSYSISSKNKDGSYEYMSKPIKFMKDKEPNDTCEIKINNAFQSFYTLNDKKYDYIMVLDYDIIETKNEDINIDETILSDDDLPF